MSEVQLVVAFNDGGVLSTTWALSSVWSTKSIHTCPPVLVAFVRPHRASCAHTLLSGAAISKFPRGHQSINSRLCAPFSPILHVRSSSSPQPPLEFYTRAIEERKWARVDIVTNGIEDDQHALNPVVPALEAKVAAGDLPANIHFYKVTPKSSCYLQWMQTFQRTGSG